MMRILTLLLALTGLALPGFAEQANRIAPRPLDSALHAMQAGRWDVAATLALRDGPDAASLIEWYRLRAGLGTHADILAFLRRHGDWPGLKYLRKQNELKMLTASDQEILEFYSDQEPQTGIGALSFARVLNKTGQQEKAESVVVRAWQIMDLTTAEHDVFVETYGAVLKPHHAARMEMALWRGLRDVKQMMPLVTAEHRKRAETRQAIENGRPGLDKWIADLPRSIKRDPGVAYAMFDNLISRNKTDRAIKLIIAQSRIKDGLGQPAKWSGWRRAIARSQMREGNHQVAYDLASVHQLTEGASYADLEWLSGYLALTHLKDAELALDHFQRFRAAVATPISLGRAGYWIGRAQDAIGDTEAAQIAYRQGALYQTSFYGLLAAERAGEPIDPNLTGAETFAPWRTAEFTRSSVYRVGILARAAGRLDLAERFFLHLSEGLDRNGLGQMGQMLADLDEPHLQVMFGKSTARRGIVLPGPYYPLHPLARFPQPVPTALALSIARRESEFDFTVVSGAGAQGLMQLMPGTARDVARELGIDHDRQKVQTDWRYNVQLGSAYLARLGRRFDGNVVMVSAGYNAGPGRPLQWIERFGDPRTGDIDIVDWIEHIPFRETRNYVMRVAESLPIYRARLGHEPMPVPFSQELVGGSVRPLAALSD